MKVDPTTGRPTQQIRLFGLVAGDPLSLDAGRGALWIASFTTGAVVRIDPSNPLPERVAATGLRIVDISAGPLGVWIVAGGSLDRIEMPEGEVVERYELPGRARLQRVDQRGDRLWVSSNHGLFSVLANG